MTKKQCTKETLAGRLGQFKESKFALALDNRNSGANKKIKTCSLEKKEKEKKSKIH